MKTVLLRGEPSCGSVAYRLDSAGSDGLASMARAVRAWPEPCVGVPNPVMMDRQANPAQWTNLQPEEAACDERRGAGANLQDKVLSEPALEIVRVEPKTFRTVILWDEY